MQIDIMNDTDISIITRFLNDDRIDTVACSPGLSGSLMALKRKLAAKFKIIVHADWDNGTSNGIDKFIGFSADDLNADGFEIHTKISNDTIQKNIDSINAAYDFIVEQINPEASLCLAFRHDNNLINSDLLRKLPRPEEYRFGIEHKPPTVSFSYRTYGSVIEKLKNIIGPEYCIKICGNIDSKIAVSTVNSIEGNIKCILNARQFTTYLKDKR